MKSQNCPISGFTIIELIIYMATLSVILIVLTEVFTSILDVQKDAEATSSVEQDGRFVLSRLIYDLKRASGVNTPLNLGNTSNTLNISVDSGNLQYNLNSNNLTLTDGQGTDRINSFSTGITNLTFQKLGNTNGKPTIRVYFTVTSTLPQSKGSETKNYQTTVSLR